MTFNYYDSKEYKHISGSSLMPNYKESETSQNELYECDIV